MNVLLLIFIVIGTVKAEECWIPGVCLGELVNQLETESPLKCLEEAKKQNASWFSVEPMGKCLLFDDCPTISPEFPMQQYLSGSSKCPIKDKVMILNGYPPDISKTIELVDLTSKTSCILDATYPNDLVYLGVGGVVNDTILICKGLGDDGNDCNVFHDNHFIASKSLNVPRYGAGSIETKNGLWITGGNDNTKIIQSTEFLTFNSALIGPNLPQPMAYHCMTRINDSIIAFVGGYEIDYLDTLYFYNEDSNTWTPGPNMKHKRAQHGCTTFKNSGKTYLLVGGGYDDVYLDTVEVLDLETLTWNTGPNLPTNLGYFDMITSPDTNSIFTFGGWDTDTPKDEVFELQCSGELDTCTWVLVHKLMYPRRVYTSIILPRDSISCP